MYKKTFGVAFIIMAVNFIFTWFASSKWDLHNMDGLFVDAATLPGFWQLPTLSFIMLILMWGAQYLDPHRENLQNSKSIAIMSILGLAFLMLVVQFAIVSHEAGVLSGRQSAGLHIIAGYGFLFGMANYLSTARKSYLSGLPTPWTIKSDLSWAKTHRFLGRSLIILGFVSLIITMIMNIKQGMMVYMVGLMFIVIAAILYSYFVWKQEADQNAI